ncbi:MAG: SurA N-terminal domain-containing protein [FCB group bacterium]|nr:SurA N-terminal domain-containing protein [FCB group bacterium]MBL7026860.1 SurA N-terminal domain-containing protein [Candidatus Neomarinimicrobiota bacterium]MBL7121437.1 SurA N-terminal domain-containing protein [Candidatus Neomarinimicrobiota bacterium]
MGVMNKMRDNMAGIMIFLVIVFVLTMSIGGLVGGADITDLLGGNQPNAFTVVNGQELTREVFMRSLQNERENYRERNGSEPTEQQMAQLTDQVWETMVTQLLIQQEIEKQDITVSSEELKYYFSENIHPSVRQYFISEAGEFDYNAYQEAVNSPQAASFWTAMSQQVASIVPVEKLQQKVLSTTQVSDAEVRAEYMKNNISFDLDYLFVKTSLYKDDEADLSEAEIQNFYDLNIEDYQQEESRMLQVISTEIKATPSDTARALNLIKDIQAEIIAGASFETTAQIQSEGPSAPNGGFLGWFGKGKMAKPFEEAAFAAPVGEVVGPILTQFGFHIIKVESTREVEGQPEVEARHILIEIRPSETTRDHIRRELKNLEFLADELGFEKAVDSLGMSATASNKLNQKDTFVSGVGSFQSAVRFAYLSEVGAHSSVMQNETHFAIFMLSEITPAGPRPYDNAKVSIKRKLMNEKKQSLAYDAASALLTQLDAENDWVSVKLDDRDGLTHETLEGAKGNTSLKGLGRIYEIFGFLENAKTGSISPVFDTPRGAIIVRLNARSDFSEEDFATQYEGLYDSLTKTRQNEVWSKYLLSLRENADVTDNRLRML